MLRIRDKIKSQALVLVVTIAIVIFTFLLSFFLVDYYDSLYVTSYLTKDNLIHNLNSGEEILLKNPESYALKTKVTINEKLPIVLETKKWGICEVGIVYAISERDTLTRSFVIGYKQETNTCLKLAHSNSGFKLAGNSRFTGDVIVPNRIADVAYISSKPYVGKRLNSSSIKKSNKNEQLKLSDFNLDLTGAQLSSKDTSVLFQPFDDEIIILNSISGYDKISGNVLIESKTPLVIPRNLILNNVIIKAPSILINEGVEGSMQLYAEDSIVLKNNVYLTYPSALVVSSNKRNTYNRIWVGDGCHIEGNIELQNKNIPKEHNYLGLKKDVIVEGQILVDGLVNISNLNLLGSLEAYKVISKYGNSVKYNTFIDVDFDALKLKDYGLHNTGKVATRMKLILDES